MGTYIYIYMCVCVCVCVCARACVCVCVCNAMEQSPFWVANSSKTSHYFTPNLGSRRFFTIFNNMPLLILRQLNPIQNTQYTYVKKAFKYYLPIYAWDIQAGSLLLVVQSKYCTYFFTPQHVPYGPSISLRVT